jgi:ankyrin repeat protein
VTSLGEAGETVRATSLHQGSHHCSSLLHAAALRGDALGVRDALSQGDDPNGGDAKGRTPLHCASLSQGLGAAEAVVMLLQAGADPALRDAQWYCALHYAAVGGRAAVIDALVEGGADLEQECRGGTTALHMASSEGHSEAVEVLLKTACADNVNHQVRLMLSVRRIWCICKCYIELTLDPACTLLCDALSPTSSISLLLAVGPRRQDARAPRV